MCLGRRRLWVCDYSRITSYRWVAYIWARAGQLPSGVPTVRSVVILPQSLHFCVGTFDLDRAGVDGVDVSSSVGSGLLFSVRVC